MISVSSLALGYLIMNLFLVSGNLSGDVCSTLFGSTSILTLTSGEMMICALFSAVVMVIYLVYYREIFRISFDEEFAEATGTRVSALKLSSRDHCSDGCSGNGAGRFSLDLSISDFSGCHCYADIF